MTKARLQREAAILGDLIADERKNLNRLRAEARKATVPAVKKNYQGWAKESAEKIADYQKWKRHYLAEAKKAKL